MNDALHISVTDSKGVDISRRQFISSASLAALSCSVMGANLMGAEAGPKINIGLIGCGGRGQWIANLFQNHGGYNFVAVADYFEDKIKEAGEKLNVPADKRFSGINAYQKLLEQKLDAVVIETPPYFHPEHAAAAVEAGKHVYLAKPIAVDVPGCRTVEQSGQKATSKKQVFLVDFQTRAHPSYQQAVKLVHEGKIGEIFSGEATYQCGNTWGAMDQLILDKPGDSEARLRGWGADKYLSGDIITEQNIHALDVASWIINQEPIKAYGTGGRKGRPVPNGCWDHYAVIYHYPGFKLSFSSKQIGKEWDDIQCRVYGTEGTIDTHYFGEVRVKCDDAYNGGRMANLYTDGAVLNIATFHENITKGNYANLTVPTSVRSNLVTLLGRAAAYTGVEVSWADLIKSNDKYEVKLPGLKS